ncbi:MAG TPA: proton-conducting transporter membrane subunit [Myxococcota bacterium]|jgi:hydrogenase-4 component F|nr:proton-conducting transporter membrane subunit [Myxococcota bacterium]
MTLPLLLVALPLALAAVAFAVSSERVRPWLVPAGGAAHLALTLAVLAAPARPAPGAWLQLDGVGRLVLALVSVLFFLCALYTPGYLAQRPGHSNRTFCACLLAFLSMASLIVASHHLGLMWVALEASTLTSAPLLYFNRNPRSLEATWKYLLLGSVGIALALLGTFFLAYAALKVGLAPSLLFEDLVRDAPRLSPPWLHAAFVVLFVGYGTKMGLAPMHTWKPDAYGEAPGLVGTLLAGVATNCAFLAIVRFFQICSAAGEADFARPLLVAMGLASMIVAGIFMVRQRDYKRMLAYSSVEHMGILVLGLGLGGAAVFGAMLHLVNNGLAKGALFLSAGNIHRAFGSKSTDEVSGALRVVPASATLFLLGFLAATGSPPFGPFVSELTILVAALEAGRWGVAAAFLLVLLVVFVGMGATVLAVVQGTPPARRAAGAEAARPLGGEGWQTVVPVAAFIVLVTLMGTWIPGPVRDLVIEAARLVEMRP